MSTPRIPLVAGIAGRVGTSTVAAALRAVDAGRGTSDADIVVCRAAASSLQRAAALGRTPGAGPQPVLAVNHGPVHDTALELLDPLADLFGAVVVLPEVRGWRDLTDPPADAAHLLARHPGLLSPGLRRHGEALRMLAAAVAGSGRLTVSARPRRRLWVGLCGVENPVPAGPGEPDDLDLDPCGPRTRPGRDAVAGA